ncbi:glycoside hydrolase superfamily [Microdochium trichocladiopsis]|uniref:beta-glucosidase n=1 Tax=Microdochium trichocladiopsis TaxID=1682393 RepID=A0A9P8XXB7_9PEZI|nr:glycoside hydrolase superfamily [Microdochium trichocladiopsis]KAH7018178.1 glycoside hydrolase superfamily [Microdochium trichocladiopsis]
MASSTIDTEHILSQLTLEEKISLLAAVDWWRTPVIKRDGLFVPHIKTTDGPNGARGESYVSGIKAACFPNGPNLGATFDIDLAHRIGAAVSREAKSKSANVLLAPTLNVIRHPLGGRNYETYSEDPLVLGLLAAAYVNGCQEEGIAATPKHFVANEAENERTTTSVEVDEQTLREIYLRPFQLVMKHSEPWCFMTSYNKVNQEYVSDSKRLIDDVLRKEWGFKGLVMSDWMGTYSTALGLEAGQDLEMPGPTKWRTVPDIVKKIEQGTISEETITTSARRVLELAKRLGRWENPEEPPERCADDPAINALIRDAGADGITLLKNEDGVLPIPKTATVAIIGQHASSVVLGGGGSARVDAPHAITLIDGLNKLGYNTRVAAGVPVFGAVPHANPSTVFEVGKTEHSPAPIKVEWYNGSTIGENLAFQEMRPQAEYMIKERWPDHLDKDYCTRITFDLVAPSSGEHLLSAISTGRAVVYIDGVQVFERPQETKLRPESFYFYKKHLERRFTHSMIQGQRYSIRMDSWAADPAILNAPPLNGKMFQGSAVRFYEHIDLDARLREASEVARACDYAVVCTGTINEIESEGFDRDSMDLTAAEYDMISAVLAANPARSVVVNFSGGPVGMTQFSETAPAIVQAWFPGQEMGDSVAAVLSGDVNPGGRLPLSWPRKVEDNPAYGNFPSHNNILRYEEGLDVGYRYYDQDKAAKPLYPFGYGLSYTTFEVLDAKIVQQQVLFAATDKNINITVQARVQNAGARAGKVVVQFYVADCNGGSGRDGTNSQARRARPPKELRAFSKVALEAREAKDVTVTLDRDSVSYYNAAQMCWEARPGAFKVLVGLSSVDITHAIDFTVDKGFTWTGV